MTLLLLLLFAAVVWGGVLLRRGRTVPEYRKESLYQTVRVERRRHVRWLRFDSRGWQGALDLRAPDKILFPYQVGFLLFRCLLPEVRSFLAIGVGTGTALCSVRRMFPEAQVYGVDIDAEVIRAAHQFFQCPDDDRAFYVAMDGRRFVEGEETDAPFDLVFLDAYADDFLPARLATVEFVRSLKERMTERGVVCVNLIGSLKGNESAEVARAWKTYREVFAHTALVPTRPFLRESQNVLLFAADAPLPDRERMLEAVEACGELPSRHKRQLRRFVRRMVRELPASVTESHKPLTDEDVRLLRY